MSQRLDHWLPRQAFKMATWLAYPNTVDPHSANHEVPSDEVIQRHIARHHIAPRLAGRETYFVFPQRRFDSLCLDPRELMLWLRLVERTLFEKVSVPNQPGPRNQFHLIHGLRCGLGHWRDGNRGNCF